MTWGCEGHRANKSNEEMKSGSSRRSCWEESHCVGIAGVSRTYSSVLRLVVVSVHIWLKRLTARRSRVILVRESIFPRELRLSSTISTGVVVYVRWLRGQLSWCSAGYHHHHKLFHSICSSKRAFGRLHAAVHTLW